MSWSTELDTAIDLYNAEDHKECIAQIRSVYRDNTPNYARTGGLEYHQRSWNDAEAAEAQAEYAAEWAEAEEEGKVAVAEAEKEEEEEEGAVKKEEDEMVAVVKVEEDTRGHS